MRDGERAKKLRRLILEGEVKEEDLPAGCSRETETPETLLDREWREDGFSRDALFELALVMVEALRDRRVDAVLRGLRLSGLIANPLLYDCVMAVYSFSPIAIEPTAAAEVRKQAFKALWRIGEVNARNDAILAARAKTLWLSLLDTELVLYAFQGLRFQDPFCAVEHVDALLRQFSSREAEVREILHTMSRDAKEKGIALAQHTASFLQEHPNISAEHRALLLEAFGN